MHVLENLLLNLKRTKGFQKASKRLPKGLPNRRAANEGDYEGDYEAALAAEDWQRIFRSLLRTNLNIRCH